MAATKTTGRLLLLAAAACALTTEARNAVKFSGRSMLSDEQMEALKFLVETGGGPAEAGEGELYHEMGVAADAPQRRFTAPLVTKSAPLRKKEKIVRVVSPDPPAAQARLGASSLPSAATEVIFKNTQVDNEVETVLTRTSDEGDGIICMKKVMMVEEIEFDTELRCEHVNQNSCFESFTTTFKNAPFQECDESFKKECEIEYFKVPKDEKVEVCNEELNRDCDAEGEEVCSTEYETICETIYQEHEVTEDVVECETIVEERCTTDEMGQEWCDDVPRQECEKDEQTTIKITPKTECRKEETEVCGPEVCPIVKGDRICRDEIKTIIQEVPQEHCSMVPRKICKMVTKLVPMLERVEHCMDVPKEVCAKSQINPVRRKKPVVRKWCGPDPDQAGGGDDGGDGGDGGGQATYLYTVVQDFGGPGTSPNFKIRILDAGTGNLECRGEFADMGERILGTQMALYQGADDEDPSLMLCGGAQGNSPWSLCRVADPATGTANRIEGLEVEPGLRDGATGVVGSKLIIVGGRVGNPAEEGVRTSDVYVKDAAMSTFLRVPFSNFFSPLDMELGRGCMQSFQVVGPNGDEVDVIVYISGDTSGVEDTDSVLIVKVGNEDAVSTTVPGLKLGRHPVCGLAADSDGKFHFVVPMIPSDSLTSPTTIFTVVMPNRDNFWAWHDDNPSYLPNPVPGTASDGPRTVGPSASVNDGPLVHFAFDTQPSREQFFTYDADAGDERNADVTGVVPSRGSFGFNVTLSEGVPGEIDATEKHFMAPISELPSFCSAS